MGTPPTGAPDTAVAPSTGRVVRLLVILGVNLALVLTVTILGSARGSLPDLNAGTLALQLLPISAAMGLMLACRRLDLALPVLFVAAAAVRANPWAFADDPWLRMLILCGLAAGVAVTSALVTWYGRIASALWTVLLAGLLWRLPVLVKAPPLFGSAGWPWTAAVAASMGFLLVAAVVLGLSRLVAPPSSPPIFRTGSHGLAGLAAVWAVAAVAIVLAAGADAPKRIAEAPWLAYPTALAAAALGGAVILRGQWGALSAVTLTSVGHLVWAFTLHANLGDKTLNALLPVAAPLVAVPLYLILDWLIRRRTGESAPTAFLA